MMVTLPAGDGMPGCCSEPCSADLYSSDSSGRWEYLALRSLDGNTELRPECPALTLAVLTLAETRRPQVRAASRQGSARKRRSGTPLVQREARSCKAREKTIHHGHSFLTHPPPSPSDSPGGAGLRASDLFTANPNILGFGLLGDASQSAGERCRTLREDGSILRCVHWMETPSSGQSVQR